MSRTVLSVVVLSLLAIPVGAQDDEGYVVKLSSPPHYEDVALQEGDRVIPIRPGNALAARVNVTRDDSAVPYAQVHFQSGTTVTTNQQGNASFSFYQGSRQGLQTETVKELQVYQDGGWTTIPATGTSLTVLWTSMDLQLEGPSTGTEGEPLILIAKTIWNAIDGPAEGIRVHFTDSQGQTGNATTGPDGRASMQYVPAKSGGTEIRASVLSSDRPNGIFVTADPTNVIHIGESTSFGEETESADVENDDDGHHEDSSTKNNDNTSSSQETSRGDHRSENEEDHAPEIDSPGFYPVEVPLPEDSGKDDADDAVSAPGPGAWIIFLLFSSLAFRRRK